SAVTRSRRRHPSGERRRIQPPPRPVIRYVARRVVLAIPVLFGVLTISFFATVSVPGDPLAGLLPENPTPEQYERVAREFGVDRPLVERWGRYVARTLQGNLGRSLRTRHPVVEDLTRAAVVTLELAVVAFLLTATIGVAIGVIAAAHENTPLDH